jgi:hypothetical protein
MIKVGDKVAAQTAVATAIEDERLYLPSDFSASERQRLDLVTLAAEEARWREGEIFDILRKLQNVVKAISALGYRKGKNDRQQKQNSRAGDHIRDGISRQNHHMESYQAVRAAIISLQGSSNFPPLTEADLFMKSVQQKRRVGDSKRTDGLLFRAKALNSAGSYDQDGDATMNSSTDEEQDEGKLNFR